MILTYFDTNLYFKRLLTPQFSSHYYLIILTRVTPETGLRFVITHENGTIFNEIQNVDENLNWILNNRDKITCIETGEILDIVSIELTSIITNRYTIQKIAPLLIFFLDS